MSGIALLAACCAVAAALLGVPGPPPAVRRLVAGRRPRRSASAARGRTAAPIALGAALVALVLLGPVGGVLAALGAAAGRRALQAYRAAAEREGVAAATTTVCSLLAAELRAGRTPDAALALAAEDLPPVLAEPMRRAAVSARLGGDVATALRSVELTQRDPGGGLLRQLATCWQVAGRTGAGLAGVVDALGTDLRARERLRLETSAALAGSRTTAWLLAGLPIVGVAMAAGFGVRPDRVLLHTPLGLTCLVLGVSLDALGVLWTRRLVRRALDPG